MIVKMSIQRMVMIEILLLMMEFLYCVKLEDMVLLPTYTGLYFKEVYSCMYSMRERVYIY